MSISRFLLMLALLVLTLAAAIAQTSPTSPTPLSAAEAPLNALKERIVATLQSDRPAALRATDELVKAASAQPDRLLEGRYLCKAARAYLQLDRNATMREVAQRAVKTLEAAHEDGPLLADALAVLSQAYWNLNDAAGAADTCERLLDLSLKRRQRDAIRNAAGNLLAAVDQLPRDERSLKRYRRILQTFTDMGDEPGIAETQRALGVWYLVHNDANREMDHYAQALPGLEKLTDAEGLFHAAAVANDIGKIYADSGRYALALDYFYRALPRMERHGDPEFLVPLFNNIASMEIRLGRLSRGEEFLQRALAVPPPSNGRKETAITWMNLAILAMERKDYAAAARDLDRGLQAPEATADPGIHAALQQVRGVLHMETRNLAEAERDMRTSLRTVEAAGIPGEIYRSLISLGTLHYNTGQDALAAAELERAIGVYEAMTTQLTAPEDLGLSRGGFEDAYGPLAAIRLRHGRPADALQILERGRAQGLARRLTSNRKNLSALVSGRERLLLGRYEREALRAERALTRVSEGPEQEPAARERRLQAARATRDETERQLSLYRDRLYAAHPEINRATTTAMVRSRALEALIRRNPDTLYLIWGRLDGRRWLRFTASAQAGIQGAEIPLDGGALLAEVGRWRRAIAARSDQERTLAATLYARLLLPLERSKALQRVRIRRLVVVADGPLLDVPFAALVDGAGRRLVERFAVASAVSLASLTWPRPTVPEQGRLLAIADPLGGHADTMVASARGGMSALRHAREEARGIAGLYAGSVLLDGDRAREAAVKARMAAATHLHFATHGVVDARSGMRSGLLLAPEPEGSPEDGILEAREIAGMRLRARLAVLSACETGRGQEMAGEGLLGLPWAFLAAGCPSVVASQWSVDDAATGQLMRRFYAALRSGARKDEALRAAMRALLRDPTYAAPYYWAAFQVIGDTAAAK